MLTKHSLAAAQEDSTAEIYTPLWFRISSLLLVVVAIILLVVVLGDRVYTSNLSVAALAAVLLALACAAFLHVRAWYVGRKGVYATEREFTSIYQHALDGILILDDRGVCLDANPAAFALLGAPPTVLIGHSFAQFYADRVEFDRDWRTFLERGYERRQAQLFRPNGSKVFVHLRATANYLPGRHVIILCDTTERVEAQDSLRESKERLQQMADNIQEIFWLLDASTKEVLQVNLAYETITGRSLESLMRNPTSYSELIHAEDRVHVLAKLEEAVHSGHLDEEFRIVRPDGEVRWVWAHGFPVRDRDDRRFRRLAGTVLDITARKLADAQVAKHLTATEAAREQAEASRAEAEALRKATLALTQNLRMDAVLDTLLRCVLDLIPYDSASVILTETDGRLFVARESPPVSANRPVVTLEVSENAFLQRVLLMKKSVQLTDTREQTDWRETKALANIRSWIAVPLVVGDSVLGLLSIGAIRPRSFSTEHFRLAKFLAIPAAVAIQNARLYEWAEIYAAERQSLLKKADGARTTAAEQRERPLPH
jgi:PAS domain S-box-containing protein